MPIFMRLKNIFVVNVILRVATFSAVAMFLSFPAMGTEPEELDYNGIVRTYSEVRKIIKDQTATAPEKKAALTTLKTLLERLSELRESTAAGDERTDPQKPSQRDIASLMADMRSLQKAAYPGTAKMQPPREEGTEDLFNIAGLREKIEIFRAIVANDQNMGLAEIDKLVEEVYAVFLDVEKTIVSAGVPTDSGMPGLLEKEREDLRMIMRILRDRRTFVVKQEQLQASGEGSAVATKK